MIFLRRRSVIAVVTSFFIIILAVNVYFVYTILEEWSEPEETTKASTRKPVKLVKGNLISGKNKGKERFYVAQGENQLKATINAVKKIKKVAQEIIPFYKNASKEYKFIVEKVISDLSIKANTQLNMWHIAEQWVTGTQVLPEKTPLLGNVLNTLCSSKIIKADNSRKGTQLKLLFTLEGGQQALFKPQWVIEAIKDFQPERSSARALRHTLAGPETDGESIVSFIEVLPIHKSHEESGGRRSTQAEPRMPGYSRNEIITGPVYAGRDRHNAEVAAFHLSLLLNLRRVPLTVGRKVNLRREIMPVATPELLSTFYQEGNNSCFYGVCLYCEPRSPVCAQGDIIEGALIMWLPQRLQFERHPHPWRRSYKDILIARWEVEEDYCERVKNGQQYVESSPWLLDLIDAVVFDFLLDNGDRHHYEVPFGLNPSSVFLFDNGKGFGNPNVDHLDILAPLYQCCIIRKTTLERLKTFAGGTLGPSLERTLKYSHIHPVLTDSHLDALDRRLGLILATVELCIRENGVSKVLS